MPEPNESKATRPILTLPRKRERPIEPAEPPRDEYVEATDEQLRYLNASDRQKARQ